ncbi:MAG: TonB-dependent receptor [Hyphomonas sp.]|nr:TonB-dependent receptor [Hyphomonas sp.]MCB9971391.1 TonB-dependent receptor [Hyphomonas sp.]
MLRRALLAGTILAILFEPARADTGAPDDADLTLDTIRVADLLPVRADDVTASVSVLTGADLAVRAAVNPADALRAVPGIGVSRSGGVGSLTQVRMRGAEANHTLVLFDGFEVSDPVTGEADFGLLTALPAGRIEVLRGEASSIYGSDAIGGVVDLFPGAANGWAGALEGGSRKTVNGALGWSGHGIAAAVSGFRTDGIDVSGLGGERDGSDALSGLVRVSTEVSSGWTLGGLALVRQSTIQSDSDLDFDGRLDNADRETTVDQYLVGATLSGMIGTISNAFRASYGEVSRDNEDESGRLDSSTGERTKLSWVPSVGFGSHSLTGLIESERETYKRDDLQYGGLTDASEAFETLGVAAEYRYEQDGLSLSASARHDDNKGRFEDATTWRAGAAYRFAGDGLRLRASAGKGVKNPTFTELFGFFPGSFAGNAALKPESSTSWEVGADWRVKAVTMSATYFSAQLKNEIYTAYNADFTSTALNRAGRSDRSGVELAARWAPTEAILVSGQFTHIDSTSDTGDDEIRVPRNTGSVSVSWQPREGGWRVGGALDFVGEQDDFDFGVFPSRRVKLDSYVLASASFEYPLTERLALHLRGENLFDDAAVDVFGYAAPGAAAYVGLKLR